MKPKCRYFNALWRREEGAAMVEFSLAFPIFLLLLVGIMEIAMALFAQALIEGAIREAARFGITGAGGTEAEREQRVRDIIQARTLGLVDPGTEVVSTLIYPGFGGVRQPEPFVDADPFNGIYDFGESFEDVNGNGMWDADQGRPGVGADSSIVLYTIRYQPRSLTNLFTPFLGDDGRFTLDATIAVRNEPFR